MSIAGKSVLHISQLEQKDFQSIFKIAAQYKTKFPQPKANGHCLALLFFEPSTRTRVSFQMAASRLGLAQTLITSTPDTSISKGESLAETFETVKAMQPDLMVVRFNQDAELQACIEKSEVPVINAGAGVTGHPTQALLDAFTILESFGVENSSLKDQKVLIVGDSKHSRVASSNIELLSRLGAEVGVVGPENWVYDQHLETKIHKFSALAQGLEWATVCMGLRIQFERHALEKREAVIADYRAKFCLNAKNLRGFSAKGLIMHPGPFVSGVDFDPELLQDKRCVIRKQVTNGVFVRAAVIAKILNLENALG